MTDNPNYLKGCAEMQIWEPKPHSADHGQSHIMAIGLSAKRLETFADIIYGFYRR